MYSCACYEIAKRTHDFVMTYVGHCTIYINLVMLFLVGNKLIYYTHTHIYIYIYIYILGVENYFIINVLAHRQVKTRNLPAPNCKILAQIFQ